MEVPSGWFELRLPPESDTREVRKFIEKAYPKMGFKILSRGEDRDFVVSQRKLDEKSITTIARGEAEYDDPKILARIHGPEQGAKLNRTPTWGALVRRVTTWRKHAGVEDNRGCEVA